MEPPVDEPTRLCPACNTTKPFSDYYKHQRGRDGLQVYCKTCMTQKVREGRTARREREAIPLTTPTVRWPAVNAPRVHRKQYLAMLQLQGGVCPGCDNPETVQDSEGRTLPLSLYGYTAGVSATRVLVCKLCSQTLSNARDDPVILAKLLMIICPDPVIRSRLVGIIGGLRQEVRVHVDDAGD